MNGAGKLDCITCHGPGAHDRTYELFVGDSARASGLERLLANLVAAAEPLASPEAFDAFQPAVFNTAMEEARRALAAAGTGGTGGTAGSGR